MYNGSIIDSHAHLWDLKNNYPWLTTKAPILERLGGNYDQLKRNFLASDYILLTQNQKVKKLVHVEAYGFEGNPVLETQWLQKQADQFGYPHGIVARAELHDPEVNTILKQHSQYPNLRAIRMSLLYHSDPNYQLAERGDYLQDKQWKKGFSLLSHYNLAFDLQIFDHQIEDAIVLAKEFPEINIVIEHFAWPLDLSTQGFKIWKERIERIGECKNAFIKLSAIGWVFKYLPFELLKNYFYTAIKSFSIDRCLFGSNFPADGMFYTFDELVERFKNILLIYSKEDQHKFFYRNAEKVYRLT